MIDDTPPKKPRGRPRVDDATKRAKAVARASAYRERRRSDRIEHTIWISREAEGYLGEIIADEKRKQKQPAPTPTLSDLMERLIDSEHLARFGRARRMK